MRKIKVLGITARKQPRVPTDIGCIVNIGSKGHVCRILNISVLGVYVAIEPVPEVGKNVELTFSVPPVDDSMVVRGVVRWNSNTAERALLTGAGIAFVDLPGDIEDLIADYVKSRTG
ncbi:MAG: PilZ domain-containing protein [bacterium]|nr:PilZ domain-containing protein [bacterium]MDT8396508.1 PilZ domain-containing protein [bacterium]